MQRALIQYRNPKNYELVKEALIKAGRTDLIGFDKKCLIRPREMGWGAGSSFAGDSKKSGNRNSGRETVGFATGTGKAKTAKTPAGSSATRFSGNNASRSAGKQVFDTRMENHKPGKKKTIRNVHKKK